jgi:hypothetical protein
MYLLGLKFVKHQIYPIPAAMDRGHHLIGGEFALGDSHL